MLGAFRDSASSRRVREGILLALGLAMMANSRPYEGFVFQHRGRGGLAGMAEGSEDCRLGDNWFWRAFLPATCVLIVAGVAMGYYYWRVTGSPFRMTYAVNRETYAVVPYFLFFSKRAVPEYHHAVMRDYYAGWEVRQFDEARTLTGFVRRTGNKIVQLWRFYLGPAFLLPLIAFPWILRDRRMRLALICRHYFCLGGWWRRGPFPTMSPPPQVWCIWCWCSACATCVCGAATDAPVGQFLGAQCSRGVCRNDYAARGSESSSTLHSNRTGRWATWIVSTLLSGSSHSGPASCDCALRPGS